MKISWVLLLGAIAGLTACHRQAAAPAPPIRPVLSVIVAPEAAGAGDVAGAIVFEGAADPSLVVVGVSEGLLHAKSTDNSTMVRTDAKERERMVSSSSEFFSPRMDRRQTQ